MIDLMQFRIRVIRPTLALLELGGPAAENLLLGTALAESRLAYLCQVGGGPALGLYQCEPATHADLWGNYIAHVDGLPAKVRGLMSDRPPLEQLVTNLAYATAIARLHYRRIREALPAAGDAAALSSYHKRHYNTVLGAADALRNETLFRQAIAAC
jgi:hypothetical protein